MNRGEDVVTDDTLGDEDGVLKVIAIPGHKGDEHVAPKRQLAEFSRRTVGDHVAGHHPITHLHQRPLVDAGVLVRALELQKVVNIDAGRALAVFGRDPDNDAPDIDLVNHTGPARHHGSARVACHDLLHACANKRRLGLD